MRKRSGLQMTVAAGLLPSALAFVVACGGDSKSEDENGATGSTSSEGTGGSSSSNGSGGSTTSDGSGGSTTSDGSGGSMASTSGGAGTTTASATTGSNGSPDDLSGTWDVIVSEPDGDASTSTVTLSPTQLRVAGELEVLALISGDNVDIAFDGDSVKASRLADSDMDLGVLPLPLAGVLRFRGVPDEGKGCDSSLQADAFTLACSEQVSTPNGLPDLENAAVDAVRTEAFASIFGDLGGSWTVTGEDIDCSVVFVDNMISVDCAQAGSDSTEVNITVDGDRISGSTSAGLEFTAQRR